MQYTAQSEGESVGVERAAGVALWPMWVGLFALSVISGLRLDDDSYQHFARSVQQIAEPGWLTFLTDLWNKPLPGLAYGIAGQLGIHAARAVAVAISGLTVALTVSLGEALCPDLSRAPRWARAALLLCQLAFLKDAFVTMTEIPAACCLVGSLWLCFVRCLPLWAAAATGCMPLCRVEMLPTAACVALWLAWQHRTRAGAVLSLAALPCALWYLAAVGVSRDLLWFRHESYAHVRAWDLGGLVRFNVLAGLAAVAPPPVLLAGFVGALALFRSLPRTAAMLVSACLLSHALVLNTLDVFPRGVEGVPLGHAVAAINARNYSCTAPLTALLAALGVDALATRPVARDVVVAVALTALVIVDGRLGSPGAMLRDLGLLALSLLALWRGQRRLWEVATLAAIGCMLIIRPFFWYPTLWNDRRAASVAELAELVRARTPARVVQDLASALEFYGAFGGVDAGWTWPNDYPSRVSGAPASTVFVLETDASGKPLTRYPDSLARCVSRAPLLAAFDSPEQPGWLTAVDRLAARNPEIHWRAFGTCDALAP